MVIRAGSSRRRSGGAPGPGSWRGARSTRCVGSSPVAERRRKRPAPLPPRRVARVPVNREHTLRETREAYLASEMPRRCGPCDLPERELRARGAQPYLQHTADALAGAGIAPQTQVEIRQLDGGAVAAAVLLDTDQPAAAAVWDSRYGWRTATSRRHPIGKHTDTAPEGEGIRYLGTGLQPDPEELLEALRDQRRGTKRPKATADEDTGLEVAE